MTPSTPPYLEWQLEQFRPFLGARVLEVGCGVGGILELLGDREVVVGIDVEEEVLDQARAKFTGRPAYSFLHADLVQLDGAQLAALTEQRFDTLICINALEHISDHLEAVRRMAGLLRPGGHLCILVPAHPTLYGPYDALDGHFRRYTRRSLRDVLSLPDLALVKLRRFNSAGAVGWWVQYRLLRRKMHGGTEFGVMNAILPVLRRAEARVQPPIGLSLVAVCRKKAG